MSETQSYKTVTFNAEELAAVRMGLRMLIGNLSMLAAHQHGKDHAASIKHLGTAQAVLAMVSK